MKRSERVYRACLALFACVGGAACGVDTQSTGPLPPPSKRTDRELATYDAPAQAEGDDAAEPEPAPDCTGDLAPETEGCACAELGECGEEPTEPEAAQADAAISCRSIDPNSSPPRE